MRSLTVVGFLASALLALSCSAAASTDEVGNGESAQTGEEDIFSEIAPAGEITIKAPLKTLFAPDAPNNELHGRKADATFASLAATLEVRGNTSLNEGECSFPKLKLKFKDSASRAHTPFAAAKKLKIITHCGEVPADQRTGLGRVANEIAPWREAFTYQLVRAAGAAAPRARPVTFRWVDTESDAEIVRKGALLEDVDDLAKRLQGKSLFVVDSELVADDPRAADAADPQKMDVADIARVHLVEAMIGNDDWRLHLNAERWWFSKTASDPMSFMWNMESVRVTATQKEIPVPGDFDLARIVAPTKGPGFVPDAFFGENELSQDQYSQLMAARQRLPRAALEAARTELLGKRAAILARTDAPWLDPEAKANAKKMLTFFFDTLANDALVYSDVVADEDIDFTKADGSQDQECFFWNVPAGTPIHRWGHFDAAHGTEEVSILDPRSQIPCIEPRVWIKKTTKTTTDFPKR